MNENIGNILFPTDFSETANNALMVAISFAKKENATLHLLHVVVPRFSNVSRSHEAWRELEKHNKAGLKKLANALEKQYKIRVVSHTAISYIHAAESIEQLAEELNISFIVMGTHGLSDRMPLFIGINTYTVMKNVSCPVLAVPVDYKKYNFRNILLPVRRESEIEETVKVVTRYFQSDSTKLEFLGVSPFNVFTSFDRLTAKIEKQAACLKNQNIEFVHRNEFCEDLADFVLEYAETTSPDLVIINPVIDDDWSIFTFGNYAQKILNQIRKPVLCIKPERHEEQTSSYHQFQMKKI